MKHGLTKYKSNTFLVVVIVRPQQQWLRKKIIETHILVYSNYKLILKYYCSEL